MNWAFAVLLAAASFAASLAGTGGALTLLRRHAILDRPNERSSHAVPIPRGAGLALVPVLLLAWLIVGLAADSSLRVLWPLGAAAGLALVSWRDDKGGLSPLLRLLCQAVAVAAGLMGLAGQGPIAQGLLPPALDFLLAGLAWLWFVNLFNFMDGIDGIAGVETTAIGLGTALVAVAGGLGPALPLYGLTAAAAALGFLWWNWAPARIFLGDVGSVPLGYLLGWLLLALAAHGQWAAALILPAYYLADATVTLLRRLARGERVWRAHREHFYQRALARGRSHGDIVRLILRADMLLIALALWASRMGPWIPLAAAAFVAGLLLLLLAKGLLPSPSAAGAGAASRARPSAAPPPVLAASSAPAKPQRGPPD